MSKLPVSTIFPRRFACFGIFISSCLTICLRGIYEIFFLRKLHYCSLFFIKFKNSVKISPIYGRKTQLEKGKFNSQIEFLDIFGNGKVVGKNMITYISKRVFVGGGGVDPGLGVFSPIGVGLRPAG